MVKKISQPKVMKILEVRCQNQILIYLVQTRSSKVFVGFCRILDNLIMNIFEKKNIENTQRNSQNHVFLKKY